MSKSEYALWMSHPISQSIMTYLHQAALQTQANWFNGAYTADTVDKTALINAEHLGRARVFKELLDRIASGDLESVLQIIKDGDDEGDSTDA